jgi:glycosyltransferase involved in cell wall biosynthesis
MARVIEIPNGIEIPESAANPAVEPTIGFVGIYSYPPNSQAGDYLAYEVLPIIRERIPRARILLAGKNPHCLRAFSDPPPGVETLGFVESLADFYGRVSVVCTPIFQGSGTRLKILEAGAYGLPVVSTAIGAEGLTLLDGREILIGDTAQELARHCIRLLEDPVERSRLGGAARQHVIRHYSRESIRRRVVSAISPLEVTSP